MLRHTRFGRDHDFAGIRTVADYQRRVPLSGYEAFWSDYWREPLPLSGGLTWPGPIPYFALSSGTTSGATKYVPCRGKCCLQSESGPDDAFAVPSSQSRHPAVHRPSLLSRRQHGSARPFDQRRSSPPLSGPGRRPQRHHRPRGVRSAAAVHVSAEEIALVNDWDEKMRLFAELGAIPHHHAERHPLRGCWCCSIV